MTTSLTKSAWSSLKPEKPHSSVTDWVDILTGNEYIGESFAGIPELFDSIGIQRTGPSEVSRAIRKKLKHGNDHQQYRALFILDALVDNGDSRLRTTLFVDGEITDVLRRMRDDPLLDTEVGKKLNKILREWHNKYKDELSMKTAANLYKPRSRGGNSGRLVDPQTSRDEQQEATKRKNKEEAEKLRKKREGAGKQKPRQMPFDFEKEKPKIFTQIASATQSANNLVNAITLVKREEETLEGNARVQECLRMLKVARKSIVRYIQLVENEDTIGTLIETNERLVAALEMYNTATSKSAGTQDGVEVVQRGLASAKIEDSQFKKSQEKPVRDGSGRGDGALVYPDLEDLNFGELGEENNGLPVPLTPDAPHGSSEEEVGRGSLSDFSDYESSGEEARRKRSKTASSSSNNYSGRAGYSRASDLGVTAAGGSVEPDEDPFADPFGDSHGVDD